jgi:hypothetical protein
MTATNEEVLAKVGELYEALFRHDGFGEIRIEMKILKKRQKEIILHCGKQYRYVVDFAPGEKENRKTSAPGGCRPDSAQVKTSASRNPAGGSGAPQRKKGGAPS